MELLIGEEDDHTIRSIGVHFGLSVGLDPESQNPHLGILKFQRVVAGIDFERIEFAGDRLTLCLVSLVRSR